MTLSVQEPAQVAVPAHIRTVGIVDRITVDPHGRILDAADKIFSLEGPSLDKEGAAAATRGLQDALTRTDRFEQVILFPEHLNTTNSTIFPNPLSWETVEAICNKNNVDALFSLDLFDTDSKINYSATPVKRSTPLGNIPALEQEVTIKTQLKTGWRIYDPLNKLILDEFAILHNIMYSDGGTNPVKIINGFAGRKDAVKQAGYITGEAYASRITPYWIRVSRHYYVKGSDRFVTARRKAQTGNWNEAAALWQKEVINPSSKIAGRACYNMAIINEINGNLATAVEWARKSYEDFNNRLALNYVQLLILRQNNNTILTQQQSAVHLDKSSLQQ